MDTLSKLSHSAVAQQTGIRYVLGWGGHRDYLQNSIFRNIIVQMMDDSITDDTGF